MKSFYHFLINTLLAATKNNFVWFALTYWAYLSTHSVVATSIVGGSYLVASAMSNFWLGAIVDHHRKKQVLIYANLITLILFSLGLLLYILNPGEVFTSIQSPYLWLMIALLLGGVVAGNVYNIAIPTLTTILVPEDRRDKANGMLGTIFGISFAVTSAASGIALGFGGMSFVLGVSIILTLISILHLILIPLQEALPSHFERKAQAGIDVAGTIKVISSIPGLFALIFFTTFNNFIGGVFMALMDAYGLTLVTVQTWGLLWGFLSFGFILGGLIIAKKGLGSKPLQTLFRINLILWITSTLFTIQPSLVLLAIGALIWMTLVPFVEATEQTIIQKVVPHKRQGRVFGFAHSIEQAASPVTALLIGPITQYIFIPFMTTGRGVDLIGKWYGVGEGRGMALVFSLSGLIGLCVTLVAMRSKSYRRLAQQYEA